MTSWLSMSSIFFSELHLLELFGLILLVAFGLPLVFPPRLSWGFLINDLSLLVLVRLVVVIAVLHVLVPLVVRVFVSPVREVDLRWVQDFRPRLHVPPSCPNSAFASSIFRFWIPGRTAVDSLGTLEEDRACHSAGASRRFDFPSNGKPGVYAESRFVPIFLESTAVRADKEVPAPPLLFFTASSS